MDFLKFVDLEAVPAKLTWQLFSGMQLGWFSIRYLAHPKMRGHRPLVKQYAHLAGEVRNAFAKYVGEVADGAFPAK